MSYLLIFLPVANALDALVPKSEDLQLGELRAMAVIQAPPPASQGQTTARQQLNY